MNKKLGEIIGYPDADISKTITEHRIRTKHEITRLMLEELGSFDGQVELVENAVDELLKKVEEQDWIEEGTTKVITTQIQLETPIACSLYWIDNKYGDGICRGIKNGDAITLYIVCGKEYLVNCSYTLAHEIMHYFQAGLEKHKGVNQISMHLYYNIRNFVNNAPSDFSKTFFQGIYICYAIEANANVSGIANYLKAFFKLHNRMLITNDSVRFALKHNTQYAEYKEIMETLIYSSPAEEDFIYIEKCLTEPSSDVDGVSKAIYNKGMFDVQKFISSNQKNIIKVCQNTIKKMDKNAMLFLKEKTSS